MKVLTLEGWKEKDGLESNAKENVLEFDDCLDVGTRNMEWNMSNALLKGK